MRPRAQTNSTGQSPSTRRGATRKGPGRGDAGRQGASGADRERVAPLLPTEGKEVELDGVSSNGIQAIRHGADGFFVVPFHGLLRGKCTCGNSECRNPGKHPISRDWPERATTDSATIKDWWLAHPNANVAIVAGPSDLLVVDVDHRHGGWESLDELVASNGGDFPNTVTAQSELGALAIDCSGLYRPPQ